ncbi:MAG: pyridoxamine 5'-phosphate oxidase family protein [Dehalococcoidia bacterium]|nr:pyridoxamine 5'-phosphate oxidase family protein [Dehalococcoidia bacterium]
MTVEEAVSLLKKHKHGRLGLALNNEPYVVPVSYGYKDGRIYFHSALKGKKIDLMKSNSRVCFEIDEWEKDKGWASVICYGTVYLKQDLESRQAFLEAMFGSKQIPASRETEIRNYVGIIEISELTARCSADFKTL